MSRTGIFKPLDERINIAFPLILIGIQLLEVAGVFTVPLGASVIALYFIADMIFLHFLHTGFSFNMLIRYPEFRQWVFDYTDGRSWRLWAKWSVFAAFLFALFYFAPTMSEDPSIFLAFVAITYAIRVQHGITQSRGLAALYDRTLEPSESLRRAARRERWLFNALMLAFLPRVFVSPEVMGVDVLPYSAETKAVIRAACASVCAMIVVAILANTWFTEHRDRTMKIPFLLRLMVVPLGYYSIVALFAAHAAHGVEYLFVTRKISERTSRPASKFGWVTYALPAVLMLIFFAPVYFLNMQTGWLYALAAMVGMLHFYMDKELFRFRHDSTRKNISPLLNDDAPAPARAFFAERVS